MISFRHPAGFWHVDSKSYHDLAIAILNGSYRLLQPSYDIREFFRSLGCPAILAATYRLLGPGPLGFVLLQAAAATATVGLAFLLGRRLFGQRAGLLAAGLLSLDVASVSAGQCILTETWFALLLVLGVWLLCDPWLRAGRGWVLALAGAVLAAAAHVRPIGAYLVPIALLWMLVSTWRRSGPSRRRARLLRNAGLFLAGPLLLIGGWQLRNLVVDGCPSFSGIQGKNMYFYRAAGVLAIAEQRPFYEVQQDLGLEVESSSFARYLELHPEARGVSPARLAERWQRDGLAILLRHPGHTLLLTARSVAVLLLHPGAFDLASAIGIEDDRSGRGLVHLLEAAPLDVPAALLSRHLPLALLMIVALVFLGFVYFGIARWLARSRPRQWNSGVVLLLIALLYLVIASAGPEARARLRVPVMPFLVTLAAAGLTRKTAPALTDNGTPAILAG